jgi:hypothetical protein
MKAPGGARVALDFCGLTGLLTASRRINHLHHPGLVASPRSSGNFCHPGLVGTLATWDLIPGLAESSHNLLPGLVEIQVVKDSLTSMQKAAGLSSAVHSKSEG